MKSPHLINRFHRLPKYGKILEKNYTFRLTCSQNFLIPLMEERQYGNITKLEKKKARSCIFEMCVIIFSIH